MKDIRFGTAGMALLCLAAVLLAQGCTGRFVGQPGVFASDSVGQARACLVPAQPQSGANIAAQMQVSNEGGWCGISVGLSPSYAMVARPSHGTVFAHEVGPNTRIDYTPDTGYVGTDSFTVRLIPSNALVQGLVAVTR